MSIDSPELIKKTEQEASPETAPDLGVESESGQSRENESLITPEQEANNPVTEPAPVSAPSPVAKDNVTVAVETILTENLGDLYLSLPPNEQQKFKNKGEETTKKIVELLRSAKATFKKIFQLILGWLRIIPGMNKFFMEQEAKIKADKIMKLE
jgi:hypothetical protein